MGKNQGYLSTVNAIYRNEGGLRGFYRGGVPTFFSLSLSTSVTFAIFESFHTAWANNDIML